MERRLTAILAADVVGYSRLMGEDEAGTLTELKAHRAEVINPKAVQYGGRIIKLMGDGVLMEFASVVDAVGFAVDVQHAMGERNDDVSQARQVLYRIGINIGDVIVEDDDIYGDGVNVAARLEGLAEAGGICIGRHVRDQIRDKLDLRLEDLGEVEVKNIARPVRAFQVVMDEKASALSTPIPQIETQPKHTSRSGLVAVMGLAILTIGGASLVVAALVAEIRACPCGSHGPAAARQAVHSGAAFQQHVRRCQPGTLYRRDDGGFDYRPVQGFRAVRHRSQLNFRLQGRAGKDQKSRRGPGCALRAGGQCQAHRRPAACQCAID